MEQIKSVTGDEDTLKTAVEKRKKKILNTDVEEVIGDVTPEEAIKRII